MKLGGPWKELFAASALLCALSCSVVLLLFPVDAEIAARPFFVATLVAVIAGLSVMCAGLTLAVAKRVRARELRKLVAAARRLAEGDLSARLRPPSAPDLAVLARALNELREKLSSHVETIDLQRQIQDSLLSQVNEGIVVARADGYIALVNPAAARMLNLPVRPGDEAGLVGKSIEQVIPQHDLQRMLLEYAADRPAAAALREARVEIELADKNAHLLARATDIVLPDPVSPAGQAAGRLLVLTDITDLARTIEMKTDFVANASHELRTPLASIRAAVEALLGMDPREPLAGAQRFIAILDRQSARLSALVGDLLDLARVESPARVFEAESVDVERELRDLAERFTQPAAAKNLSWSVASANGAGGKVLLNSQLLRIVLDNLVDNAIKFTEAGGKVQVRCRRTGDRLEFEVSDTGCGIPEEDRDRVFERFYQVERARSGRERGTGLGLSIVRHAVAAMRGSVRLESEPGKGTRVAVELPQQAVDSRLE